MQTIFLGVVGCVGGCGGGICVRTAMFHSRRTVTLTYWCIPKPEPVSTRPPRGHKTDLKNMRIEEVIKVMWRRKKEEKRKQFLGCN